MENVSEILSFYEELHIAVEILFLCAMVNSFKFLLFKKFLNETLGFIKSQIICVICILK